MRRTAIRNGWVFDGTGSPASEADVVMERGRIVEVGPGLDGDYEFDATGSTVIPGLFDCHVHTTLADLSTLGQLERPFSYQFYVAARNLSSMLDCGITTVRDAAGADLGIKQAVDDGLISGPRMRIAVSMLGQTGGHGDGWMASGHCVSLFPPHPGRPDGVVDGPEGMRRRAREVLRAGADTLKVCVSGGVLSPRDDPHHAHLRPDELSALVAEAHAADVDVMAHATAATGVKNAVRAGIRSIEHGIHLDDEAIDMMLSSGTWLVPTLSALESVLRAAEAGVPLPQASISKARDVIEAQRESFRKAVAAGVRVAMGTDGGVTPFGDNLGELMLMNQQGMAQSSVLTAATSSAAKLLGLDQELGRIEPGMRADLVVVAGTLERLDGLKNRIRLVYKDGVAVRGGPPGESGAADHITAPPVHDNTNGELLA